MHETKIAGIGSDAVVKATGKSWKEWVTVLDKVKASKLPHKEIAKLLHQRHGLSGWWSQMVTVGYEQAKGLRKANERPEGFQISKSKTISASRAKLFTAISDSGPRTQWIGVRNYRITTKNKSKNIRGKWHDGKSSVSIDLYRRDNGKTQVVLQHSRLKSKIEAEKMKSFWQSKLGKLSDLLS